MMIVIGGSMPDVLRLAKLSTQGYQILKLNGSAQNVALCVVCATPRLPIPIKQYSVTGVICGYIIPVLC